MNESSKTLAFVGAAFLSLVAAYATAPRGVQGPSKSDVVRGPFYDDFGPNEATSLRVVTFNEEQAKSHIFAVELRNGLWVIPSHHDYPADAADRLARTAASTIGVKPIELRSTSKEDHEKFGVVDPLDEDGSKLKGRGQRITLTKGENLLFDLIVGKQVKDHAGHYYVRKAGKDADKNTYVAKLEIDLSTKFGDWIETDLLKIDRDDLSDVQVNDYEIKDRGLVRGENYHLTRAKFSDPWKLDGLDEKASELETAKITDMVSTLDELKLIGVRPKPAGLSKDLKLSQGVNLTQGVIVELSSKGFQVTRDGQLFSNAGETLVGTSKGVRYVLRFGEVFSGTDSDIESGLEAASREKKDGDKKDDSKESKSEAKPGESKSGRYVFVTAMFEPELLGPRPVKPEKPNGEDKPSLDTPEKKPDDKKPDEKKPADDKKPVDEKKPEEGAPAKKPATEVKDGEKKEATGTDSGCPADDEKKPDDEKKSDEKKTDDKKPDDKKPDDKKPDEKKPDDKPETKTGDAKKPDDGKKPAEGDKPETKEGDKPEAAPKKTAAQLEEEYQSVLRKYEADVNAYDEKVKKGRETVDKLNRRFADWFYVISGDNFSKLRPSKKDLVKEKKTEPETKPETPETKKPDAGKPDATKPDAGKPEPTKPDTTKPDTTKPDAGKPEVKSDEKKPEAKPTDAKPTDAKPTDAKPDEKKPEAKKPDEGKPAEAKPEGK